MIELLLYGRYKNLTWCGMAHCHQWASPMIPWGAESQTCNLQGFNPDWQRHAGSVTTPQWSCPSLKHPRHSPLNMPHAAEMNMSEGLTRTTIPSHRLRGDREIVATCCTVCTNFQGSTLIIDNKKISLSSIDFNVKSRKLNGKGNFTLYFLSLVCFYLPVVASFISLSRAAVSSQLENDSPVSRAKGNGGLLLLL